MKLVIDVGDAVKDALADIVANGVTPDAIDQINKLVGSLIANDQLYQKVVGVLKDATIDGDGWSINIDAAAMTADIVSGTPGECWDLIKWLYKAGFCPLYKGTLLYEVAL